MAGRYSYRDLAHPSLQDTLKSHNYSTLKLVKTVAEFAQKISLVHEQFAAQIQSVVETFKKKNQDLKKERGPIEITNGKNNMKRPLESPSSLCAAWEALLQETQYDAQAHGDIAGLLIKNVYNPLLEIAAYKKSQAKRLYAFRENLEAMLPTAEENVQKCRKSYIEAYQNHRNNVNSRDAARLLAAYHNAHNDYVLHLRASNRHQEEYHCSTLPFLLEELEEIHIDLANTLNGGIESHALLLLTKASEQNRRFEAILQMCSKQVNPKTDIHNLMKVVCPEPPTYDACIVNYEPPVETSSPESEETYLGDTLIVDRHTEATVAAKRQQLQKEAASLASFLKQQQEVTHTLVNVCQRNLANHLYAKVYETQEDLSRKRNEIRLANLQLTILKAQIELLTPKQNGTALDVRGEGASSSSSKSIKGTTIRGMWKKAFKSLQKTKPKGDKGGEMAEGRDKEDKGDSSDERKQYSRMTSRNSQSSLKKILKKKKVPTATLR